MLSRFVIAFLPRSKCSWLQSLSSVILGPKKIKSVTASTFSSYICHEVMEPDAMIFIFWMLSFKPAFSLSSFTFIKRLFSSSLLSAIRLLSWDLPKSHSQLVGETLYPYLLILDPSTMFVREKKFTDHDLELTSCVSLKMYLMYQCSNSWHSEIISYLCSFASDELQRK